MVVRHASAGDKHAWAGDDADRPLDRKGLAQSVTIGSLLTAYGGYGLSLKPWFSPDDLVWLERGGVYAVANLRGGGEYGKAWHEAGRLTTKQNCFDDFIACADHLVETGVTRRDRLAILGGSNGGLLMGAVLTQRPDLAAAGLPGDDACFLLGHLVAHRG